jgi:O-antigen/teichoic acid export membrane protein
MRGIRHQRFTLALASGYFALLCTVGYSFLLVPLSLAHVSLGTLGLWFLGLQACRYLELIDLGISGASLRLISQSKFQPEEYRKTMASAWCVQVAQGCFIAGAGWIGSGFLARLLVTDAENQGPLADFIFWIFFLNGIRFGLRIFPNLLRVNQLQHLLNLLTSLGILANLGVLAVTMLQGFGPASFLWGFAAEWAIQALGPVILVATRGDLTHRLELGRPSGSDLRALSRFGLAVFQMNSLRFLLESAPLILAGRFFGPEASAAWSIVARAGTCLRDLLAQIQISAAPAFYDLMARGERSRMNQAFTRLSAASLSLGWVLLTMFAVWDSVFVSLWTSGKCVAPPLLPTLIAGILWMQIWNAWSAEASVSLLRTRPMAMAFLQEGAVFLLVFAIFGRWGLVELAAASLLASLTSSFPRGMVLFRELWDKSALSRGTLILLGRGVLTVGLLWLAAISWQALFPPINLQAFGLGVLATGLLALVGWGLWLGPSWLMGLARGLPNRPS